jgi:ribA/ribD-fused uncharacterized protein
MSPKFYYFWRGPLSNWYPSEFMDYKGNLYNCVEQYMMAKKALLFNDVQTYADIMAQDSPRNMKSLGRRVKNYVQDTWDNFNMEIVWFGCFLKFTQNPDLQTFLLNTGDKYLVEASPYDRVWGIGYSEKDAPANMGTWGENKLGNVLTSVRDVIGGVV